MGSSVPSPPLLPEPVREEASEPSAEEPPLDPSAELWSCEAAPDVTPVPWFAGNDGAVARASAAAALPLAP